MELQLCSSSSMSKADRKTIEKNRRNQMKALYMKLNSLVPRDHQHYAREVVSLPDQLEDAANYIKKLQINLERMRLRKDNLTRGGGGDQNSSSIRSNNGGTKKGYPFPHIEIHHPVDSALEVVLITGLGCQFMFNAIIGMIHEEGIEVINASYTIIGDTIFHSIHSKVGACAMKYGVARISDRLKQFVATATT